MISCFFIGHRECGAEILPALEAAVDRHIREYGVTQFIVGGYGGFDSYAARAVINAKASHPEITLLLLTPYHPAERPVDLRKGFDNSYYPFEGKTPPRRVAIVKANDIMIHSCDYLIAYAWHPASNARDLVEKAQRLEKQGGIKVENLAEDRLRSRLDGRSPDTSLQSNPSTV